MEKKNMTVKDRMNEVLRALGISSSEFERQCDLGEGFVSRINEKVRKQSVKKIANVFPSLNMAWVTHERGEMFSAANEGNYPLETIRDRILYFSERMNLSQGEFVRKAGLGVGFIGKSSSPRRMSLNKIYNAFPMLNPSWLEGGKGEMLREVKEVQLPTTTVTERLRVFIKFLGVTLSQFEGAVGLPNGFMLRQHENITSSTVEKIVSRYPFANAIWIMHGTGEMISAGGQSLTTGVAPLVDKNRYGEYVQNHDDMAFTLSLPRFPYVPGKPLANPVAFVVAGDSMTDGTCASIPDGAIVLGSEVSKSDDMTDGRDYVIIHRDGILIKRVVSRDDSSITVRSLNQFYGDVVLSLDDIIKVFVVVQVTVSR